MRWTTTGWKPLVLLAAALAIGLEGCRQSDDAATPAFARGSGPSVLVDLGHHNHAIGSERARLAKWLEEDGYRVRELAGPFDRGSLDGVQILVIKNALSARNALPDDPQDSDIRRAWGLPTPSAFTKDEIEVLHAWVLGGGALLWVFDHMPMPGAAQELAAVFGIEVSNGNAVDDLILRGPGGWNAERAGRLVFSRSDGTLADDPVTNGRGPSERVDAVASDGGSAFRLPPQARSLLTFGPSCVSLLPNVAWEFSEATPQQEIAGWSQGGVLRAGKGRLAVFGDGALLMTPDAAASVRALRAQSADPTRASFDENPKLLLNVVHWLSGLLDDESRLSVR